MPGPTIQAISLYQRLVPVREPFVISLGPINHVQNIVVVLRTADGHVGYGECSPFLTINSEGLDTYFVAA